jgi:hypothetical protein
MEYSYIILPLGVLIALILISMMCFKSKGITVTVDRFEYLPYQVEANDVYNLLTPGELEEIFEKEVILPPMANGEPGLSIILTPHL